MNGLLRKAAVSVFATICAMALMPCEPLLAQVTPAQERPKSVLVVSLRDSAGGLIPARVQSALLPSLSAAGVQVIPQSEVNALLATRTRPTSISDYRDLGTALHATVTIALDAQQVEHEVTVRGTIILPQDTTPRAEIVTATGSFRVPHCIARAILSDTTIQRVLGLDRRESSDSVQLRLCRAPTEEEIAEWSESENIFRQFEFGLIGGLHVGTPAVLSASVGVRYGLGHVGYGSLFVDAEPGLFAFRYSAGYFLHFDQTGTGGAIRAARMTGWRDALGITRGVQYTGMEVTLMPIAYLNLRVGAYGGTTGAKQKVGLFTVDLGMGY